MWKNTVGSTCSFHHRVVLCLQIDIYWLCIIYMCVFVSLSLCYYCVCQGCNGNPRISMHPGELVYVYGKHLPTSTRASQPNRMGRDGAVWLKIGVEGQTKVSRVTTHNGRVSHAIHHFGGLICQPQPIIASVLFASSFLVPKFVCLLGQTVSDSNLHIWSRLLPKVQAPVTMSVGWGIIWLWINTYENTIFRGLFTSINPSYFDVNYRGNYYWFWHTATAARHLMSRKSMVAASREMATT